MNRLVVAGIILALLSTAAAVAHDRNRPDLDPWFRDLKSGKGPCCSNADGWALSDVDWESKDGHYRVKLKGEWVDVPDDAVLKVPNLYGPTMVWPMYWDGFPSVRCFMPGSMG